MVHLELNQEEALILHRILESCDCEMRADMAGTDVQAFSDALRKEEELIHRILEELEAAGLTVPETMSGNYE